MDSAGGNNNVSDFEAIKQWNALDNRIRKILLNNAYCPSCEVASFAPGYTLVNDKLRLAL